MSHIVSLWPALEAAAAEGRRLRSPQAVLDAAAPAVAGLGPLTSAAALHELATRLAASWVALELRWAQVSAALLAAASTYAAVDGAVVP